MPAYQFRPMSAADLPLVRSSAVRAYEKAGFLKDRLVDTPDGPALLMVRNA